MGGRSIYVTKFGFCWCCCKTIISLLPIRPGNCIFCVLFDAEIVQSMKRELTLLL